MADSISTAVGAYAFFKTAGFEVMAFATSEPIVTSNDSRLCRNAVVLHANKLEYPNFFYENADRTPILVAVRV